MDVALWSREHVKLHAQEPSFLSPEWENLESPVYWREGYYGRLAWFAAAPNPTLPSSYR